MSMLVCIPEMSNTKQYRSKRGGGVWSPFQRLQMGNKKNQTKKILSEGTILNWL